MPKRKGHKSGALTLRIPPDLHEEIAQTAADLGLDMAGLMRLIFRRALPHFQLEARVLQARREQDAQLLEKWQQKNPNRPIREFWDDYYKHQCSKWLRERIQQGIDNGMTMEEAYLAPLKDPFEEEQQS